MRTHIASKVVAGAAMVLIAAATRAAPPENPSPSKDASLETVVVQGRKLNVEAKIDRRIYTVPDDAQSTIGTVSDILGVIPSIDVDPDGVVSLRGDTNVLILIDGRPAIQLQGSKGGDNLQSMSARDIERIEVLTTPPAQFKAEGAAGVINIITRRRGPARSASGSLQASVGDGGRRLVGGNGSVGNRQLSATLNAGYREDYRQRTIESESVGPDPTTGQVLESRDRASQRLRRDVPTVDISVRFDPNDTQSLSGSASWMRRGGLRTYTQLDDSEPESGGVASSTRRLTSGRDPEDDYNTTLGYTQKFSDSGETLDLSAHHAVSHQHEHYDYVNDSFAPPAPTFYDNLSFTEDKNVTEVDADFSLPLSTTQTIKLGYAFEQDEYAFNTVGANVDPLSGMQTVDPTLVSDFSFRQRIHAIYQSYQGGLGAWAWLIGVRTEWTSTDGTQTSDGSSTATRYADVYPSLHIDRTLSDHSTLSFGASRRITRPDPSYLNPYVDHEYPPNFTAGNPRLSPQFTQSFDVGYAYEGRGASYGLTGYFRRNRDSATDVTEYLGGGLSLTTKANLPRNDSAGLEFSATGHLAPKLGYSLSGNAFYSEIDATALGVPGIRSTTGLNAKAKLDYRPTGGDSLQVACTRTDRRLTPQGSISAINIVNLGFRHMLTPALAAVATVSDLFNGQHFERVAATPSFTQVYQRRVEGRIVYVGLTYAIGLKKEEKQPSFEYDSGG